MSDKCCSNSWSLGYCCSDGRGKNEDETLQPIQPLPQTQMEKPTSEPMPIPEEDVLAAPASAEEGEVKTIPLEPAAAPQGMQISGSTSSIGATYTVSFDSSLSQQIGLEFEILDPKNCLVSNVKDEGQVADWNRDAAPRDRVKRYDCLRLVNGMGSSFTSKELVNMVAVCRGSVELTLERPTVLHLDVKRAGCKLGLAVAASKSDLGLLVRGVDRDGAILSLNEKNDTDYIIGGDRIVTINGSFLAPATIVLSRESVVRRLLVQFVILALRGATPAAVGFLIRNIWMNASPHHFHPRVLVKYGLISWCLAETIFMIYIWQYTRFLNGQTTRRWRAVNVHNTAEKRRASMERYLLAIQQVAHGGDQAESRPKNTFQKAATNHFATPGLKGNNGLRLSSSTASLKRTASFLMGVVKQEESVEDLLKHMEGSSGNLEAELQRLRWHELATFFHGPGRGDADEITEWLQRDNVKDWIAHYWFRGATPEELMEDNPQQFQELRALVDLVLQTAGLQNLPQGRNPKLIAHRVSSDPLPVVHRPLMVYAGTSLLCPMVSYKVMQWLGFHRERAGGLCYWKRSRQNVAGNLDLAAPRQVPLVFIHGLGVGLVPYFLFIYRLTQRHSGDLFVPEFPFLAMAPWESVPSAREVVSQLQDMLAAHGHTSAQWAGHSFGCVVIGWVMKMSPSSMRYATLMEPAQFLIIKAEALTKILWGRPGTTFEILIRYFAFRELFTVNLLCRNFFWEQSSMWPEDLKVPSIIALAGDDHIVQSTFVRRLLEHEKSARRLKKRMAAKKTRLPTSGSSTDVRVDTLNLTSTTSSGPEPLEILWNEGFFHGQILCDRRAQDRLFLRMKSMVREESEG